MTDILTDILTGISNISLLYSPPQITPHIFIFVLLCALLQERVLEDEYLVQRLCAIQLFTACSIPSQSLWTYMFLPHTLWVWLLPYPLIGINTMNWICLDSCKSSSWDKYVQRKKNQTNPTTETLKKKKAIHNFKQSVDSWNSLDLFLQQTFWLYL